MHKWKDKVELSLDNRQIFFAFFGVSVVGCFVFALGVMAGRRLEGGHESGPQAMNEASSLQALDADPAHEAFVFEKGLAESELDAVPPTRDPSLPPRSKEEIAAAMDDEADGELAVAKPTSAGSVGLPGKAATKNSTPAKVIADADQATKPAAAGAGKNAEKNATKAEKTADAAVLANATPPSQQVPEPAQGSRVFTLQMKAFAEAADADKLAETLRGNGHDVRVDVQDVRGRVWHRVRLGKYTSWDDAVAAKLEFEKHEKMIAYVMTN